MFVDIEDVIARIGNDRVLQFLDHDGDGVADEKLVQECTADADAEVSSILVGKGFTLERLRDMSADPLLRRCAAEIFMGYMGEQKPEFLNEEGKGPYDKVAERARKRLREIASGISRAPRAETQHGANTSLKGELFEPEPKTYFLPRPDRPRGPGGF